MSSMFRFRLSVMARCVAVSQFMNIPVLLRVVHMSLKQEPDVVCVCVVWCCVFVCVCVCGVLWCVCVCVCVCVVVWCGVLWCGVLLLWWW